MPASPARASPRPAAASATSTRPACRSGGYELDVFGRLRGLDTASCRPGAGLQQRQQAVRTNLIASVVNAEIALQSDAALRRISQDT